MWSPVEKTLEAVFSELLGTLCDKRHDAVVVMHFHLSLARENTTPTRAITVTLYANSCICLQIG